MSAMPFEDFETAYETLATAIDQAREFQRTRPETSDRRRAIARWRILELLREQLVKRALDNDGASERLDRLAEDVATKQRDPYSAAEELMNTEVRHQRSDIGHQTSAGRSDV